MKLSILIPVYNAKNYIGNCIESLINQDLSEDDYEIIIIDDGSKDNSVEIITEYTKQHKNISLYQEPNSGVFTTRNKLLKLAKGDYIYNLDADDYITRNSLKLLLDIAVKNDVDFLSFDSMPTARKDLYTSNTKNIETDLSITNGIDFLSENWSHHITVWWYFVKRDFIVTNGIVFDENNPLGDGPFTFRLLLEAQKIIHAPMDIHRYVNVPDSITHNKNQDHLNKMIGYYVDIIHRYNNLEIDVSKRNDINLIGAQNKIKHWRDVNVYVMFYTFIKSNASISAINKILIELKKSKIYPIKHFIGDRHNSLKHRVLTYLFNHKYIFYTLLYPFRLLYKLGLIKFS